MRALIPLLLCLLAPVAQAGPFDRPELAEAQRRAWIDFLIRDGSRRYEQGRVLTLIGGSAVMIGAGLSLAETLENGPSRGAMRPGAAIALAGAPFLLAGLPSMTAGNMRMRRAMRMDGIIVPHIPGIAAWSLLGAIAALPVATLFFSVGSLELAFAGGLLASGVYALSAVQYRINSDALTKQIAIAPIHVPKGAGLALTARW
ncbi:MAG: hypothetical protein KC912_03540 [Proteobacteria bacterium]|nr:hypothetical protein [Pseudomonadota bacterium]